MAFIPQLMHFTITTTTATTTTTILTAKASPEFLTQVFIFLII